MSEFFESAWPELVWDEDEAPEGEVHFPPKWYEHVPIVRADALSDWIICLSKELKATRQELCGQSPQAPIEYQIVTAGCEHGEPQ